MKIDILSLFPEYFTSPLNVSMLKRAQENGILDISLWDIRRFSQDKQGRVDDRPYGGGPGMVMMAAPVTASIRHVRRPYSKVIYLSPQGKPLNSDMCKKWARCEHVVLVCGHYEGIDQRAIDSDVDEEISIGDVVLTNGCLAALVLLDAMARFIPGMLGDERGAKEDSFESSLLDCSHYTRPEEFEGKKVPAVLLKGDHRAIMRFRAAQALNTTRRVRYDLYLRYLYNKGILPSVSTCKEVAVKEHSLMHRNEGFPLSIVVRSIDSRESAKFYSEVFAAQIVEDVGSLRCVQVLPGVNLSIVECRELKELQDEKKGINRDISFCIQISLGEESALNLMRRAQSFWNKRKDKEKYNQKDALPAVVLHRHPFIIKDPDHNEWVIWVQQTQMDEVKVKLFEE